MTENLHKAQEKCHALNKFILRFILYISFRLLSYMGHMFQNLLVLWSTVCFRSVIMAIFPNMFNLCCWAREFHKCASISGMIWNVFTDAGYTLATGATFSQWNFSTLKLKNVRNIKILDTVFDSSFLSPNVGA